MAEIPTRAGPTALATTTTTIKTAGAASTWVIVRSILATNVDTVARTVTVGIGTANTDTAAKRIANAVSILPGETLELLPSGYQVLTGGATPDLLYALCSAASAVNLTLGMVEGP